MKKYILTAKEIFEISENYKSTASKVISNTDFVEKELQMEYYLNSEYNDKQV